MGLKAILGLRPGEGPSGSLDQAQGQEGAGAEVGGEPRE